MAALAADALPSYQDDFFRSLLGDLSRPSHQVLQQFADGQARL
jgi:hypothetical protein